MGSIVCLCGKRYKDPINIYTEEKDPAFLCQARCLGGDTPTWQEVVDHNNNHDSVRADPPTPAKGSTPAREVSPSRGEG